MDVDTFQDAALMFLQQHRRSRSKSSRQATIDVWLLDAATLTQLPTLHRLQLLFISAALGKEHFQHEHQQYIIRWLKSAGYQSHYIRVVRKQSRGRLDTPE